MSGPRRLPALLVIVGLLVAGGVADRVGRSRATAVGPAPAMAVAPAASALACLIRGPIVGVSFVFVAPVSRPVRRNRVEH